MKKNFLQDASYGNVKRPTFSGLHFVILIIVVVLVGLIYLFAQTWIASAFQTLRSMIVINAGDPRFAPRNVAEQSLIQALTMENTELRATLGRKDSDVPSVLATVLDRPPRTPYDSLLIDIGADHGLAVGDLVMVDNYYVVGSIESVNEKTALVVLFSSPTQKIDALLRSKNGKGEPSDAPDMPDEPISTSTKTSTKTASKPKASNISTSAVTVEGRGGGNYYIKLPKNIDVAVGDPVTWPSVSTVMLGAVEEVDSSEGDAYAQIYFKSPVNINAIRYVQVKKGNH